MRHVPINPYEELKKRCTVSITPTGLKGLDALCAKLQICRSEFLEQLGRGLISLDSRHLLNLEETLD
ncbi:hypothetical protein [Alkalinema sp. FACHB-956]|uniref:hypothetical protein n=1 Tax=Alkalinema sp. FACHB-956 TaxID=2692768 RepID=UPI001685F9BE|nr:hypothetical protein [Alkalinema sp. FACHB-956]MBD2329672.1 hypothetical protein [Alkalinema sp. FACHB-956]